MSSVNRTNLLRALWLLNRDLAAWIGRRPQPEAEGSDVEPSRDNMFLSLVIVATLTLPVETLLFFVLIPASWWWLRDLLLVLAVEATILAWGFYASTIRVTHRLTERGILVRWSRFAEALVPYSSIAGIAARRERSPTGQGGLTFHPREPEAFVTNGLSTNLAITLNRPITLAGLMVQTRSVTSVHLDVLRPEVVAQEVANRLAIGVDSAGEASASQPELTLPASVGAQRVRPLSDRALVGLTLAMEVPLFLIGYFWMIGQGLDPLAELRPTVAGAAWGAGLGVAIASLSLGSLAVASRFRVLATWREFVVGTLGAFLGSAGLPALCLLSVAAGIGEEVFFRGALQNSIGWIPTALVFALAHVGLPKRELIPFVLYVFIVGLAFGYLRQTWPLFPLVIAHAAIDLIDSTYLHIVAKRATPVLA